MRLTLHYHPLASFCWKVLIALYERGTSFDRVIVDLGDPESRERFARLSPLLKMPVLEDAGRAIVVAETTIIVEYLDLEYPAPDRMIPVDPGEALSARALDRFWDLAVQVPMQKIVTDRIRPDGAHDPYGVAEARDMLATACSQAERALVREGWGSGGSFGLADCAASPALFYADKVMPLAPGHPRLAAYLERLKARPSFARVLTEAEPYFANFPE